MYPFSIRINPEWTIDTQDGKTLSLSMLLGLLAEIDISGNIVAASETCGHSYRHAWGVLRQFEEIFGVPLLITKRRKGTELSEFAKRLVWANRRIQARLSPTLESLASESQEELEKLIPEHTPNVRLHASHGFAVEGLTQRMNSPLPILELRYRTAIEALAALEQNECELAGFQVPIGKFEKPILARYSPWLNAETHLLIHLAIRNTGLFVKPGNPKNIQSVRDLARDDVRFVNRQPGSSTRFLVGLMLQEENIPTSSVSGFEDSEFTHMAIAAHIASGMADVGIGVQTAAHRFGLEFIPLVRERYFFALNRNSLQQINVEKFIHFMRSQDYLQFLGQLVGYDATEAGKIQTLDEAFND